MRRHLALAGLFSVFMMFNLACSTDVSTPADEDAAEDPLVDEAEDAPMDPEGEVCCEVTEAGDGGEPEVKHDWLTRGACLETGNTVADDGDCDEEEEAAEEPAPRKPKRQQPSRTVTKPVKK